MSDLFFGNFVFGMDEIVPYEEYTGPTDLLGEVMQLLDEFVQKEGSYFHIERVLPLNPDNPILFSRRQFGLRYPRGGVVFIKDCNAMEGLRILLDFKEGADLFHGGVIEKPSYYLQHVNLEVTEMVEKIETLRDWLYDIKLKHA